MKESFILPIYIPCSGLCAGAFMFPPRWFLPYDALFQLITAFVALAVAMYALKGHQWVRERTLYALFLAFLLLSIGLFINCITLTYAYLFGVSFTSPSDPLSVADMGFWAYYALSMFAYSLLVFAYTLRLRESSMPLSMLLLVGAGGNGSGGGAGGGGGGGGAAGSTLLTAGPVAELILVILLLIIVISQLAHLMVRRSRYAIMVTLSFLFMLVSHLLIMFSSHEDIVYVVGRVLELTGFLSLFVVLYGLRRGG